ncbi:MAG: NifU family protein [Bacillota bacterium]
MEEKINSVLDKVRPQLKADGGDVELVEYKDGVVKLRLTGVCGGCPFASMTLKNGIERMLKQEIPEIKQVISV